MSQFGIVQRVVLRFFFFFFNDTATTEIYTLSIHDALPISARRGWLQLRGSMARPQREILQHRSRGLSPAARDRHGERVHGRHARRLSRVVPPISTKQRRAGGGRGRNIDVEQLWRFVSTYDYVAGDFMWTGIDYLGESRWPGKGSSAGVIDTCGFKKDGFYFYQSQWTDKPVLHLSPHWNWKGREGQFIPVTCYTNCDTVELFLNGKSVGAKGYAFPRYGMEDRYGNTGARARVPRTTADLHLEWDVPYEPGTP